VANWTSVEELVRKLGRRRVIELFDEDGDGTIDTGDDATTVDDTVAAANDEVTGVLLRKGFSAEQLNGLSEDASLRRHATSILAQLAGERKTEFLDAEGKGPYDAIGERARKELEKFSRGEKRSRLEDQAGDNPIVGGDVNLGSPVFIFSRDPRNPGTSGPGGF